jgi:hypothetical protein
MITRAISLAQRTREAIQYRIKPRHLPFFFQRMFLNPNLRERIAGYLASRLKKMDAQLDEAASEPALQIAQKGYAFVESLITETQIREMRSWLDGRALYDRFDESVRGFTQEGIPAGTHVAPYQDVDVINCPHVMAIANDPRVLSIVSMVLGCAPTISNLSIWWSVGDGQGAQAAEKFHRDVDDWRFLKLFVYLTEVTDSTGPHMFVEGSHRVPQLLAIRRYSDQEVVNAFGKEPIRRFLAPAGTAFLENTFGLHKGLPVTDGRRLLFQVLYSMYPIGIYEYNPRQRTSDQTDLNPYTNRLYLRPQN